MKKVAITLLIVAMTVSLISCGKVKEDKVTDDNNIVAELDNGNSPKDNENSTEDKPPIEIKENNDEDNEAQNNNEKINEPVNEEINNFVDETVEETPVSTPVVENVQDESQEASRNCRLFFYNGTEDSMYYKDAVVTVVDKAVTKALTNGLKVSPGGNLAVIPSYVEVVSAKLDGDSIIVDLSSNYYDFSSNLGSAAELGMLESLALTYSYNYNVSNVRILVGGKNYSSGHLVYGDNEYIQINHIEAKGL